MQRLEIVIFSPGVTARPDSYGGIGNAEDELRRGAAAFEILDAPGVLVLDDIFPVDDGSHSTVLEITHAGRGFLHMIPRGPTSVFQKDGGSLERGGKVIPVTDPRLVYAVLKSEVGPSGRPTGRDLIHAFVRVG